MNLQHNMGARTQTQPWLNTRASSCEQSGAKQFGRIKLKLEHEMRTTEQY